MNDAGGQVLHSQGHRLGIIHWLSAENIDYNMIYTTVYNIM